ncbi:flagellar hook protein FlgE [Halomonas sp. WWR20]
MGFSQALSGVNAASTQLDAIGNNISNSQTKGFKSSSVQFADVFAGSQVGLGTRVAGVLQNFNNGTLETTNRDLDLAISGDGFFRFNQGGQVGYSRNGQLTMTSDGYLVNAQGAQLTGYNVSNFNTVNAAIPTGGQAELIQLPADSMVAQATTKSSAGVDLDAGDEIPTEAFNAANASTYNYSTSTTFYDSLGNSNNLQMYFIKTGDNAWQVESRVALGASSSWSNTVEADGNYPAGFAPTKNGTEEFTYDDVDYVATVTGGSTVGGTFQGGTISYQAKLETATLEFDSNGKLKTAYNGTAGAPVTKADGVGENVVEFAFNGANGAAKTNFTFDFSGSSQTAQDYAINSPQQDGYASGQLVGIQIEDDGTIVGNYSNEKSIDLARVALANFGNKEGLQSIGDNMWAETGSSGAAVIGAAGVGKFGTIESGTLEASNVDLTKELVDLIIAQRNFQANTNTIKTQDEILQTVVNLK